MNPGEEPLRIAVLTAHPDDAEIWCGGTILKHTSRGDRVRIFGVFCQAPARVTCAHVSARALGATYSPCGRELSGMLDEAAVRELAEFAPHMVLTHWEHDSHPDHVLTFRCAYDAVIRLARLSVNVNAMFCFTTYNNRGTSGFFAPEFYVDVSREWTAKVVSIHLHADQDPERIVHDATPLFAAHGRVIGAEYAEVFLEVPIFGRLRSRLRSPAFLA